MLYYISKKISIFAGKYLPSPFSITIFLTLIVFIFANWMMEVRFIETVYSWQKGFWELLTFTMQMSLILVFGHVLASTDVAKSIIRRIVKHANTTETAVVLVAVFSLLMSFLNWGLGLVFGAILARKVAEHAQEMKIKINYPIIGAAGYSGLVVWHGGFSGSAPLTIATKNHFLADKIAVIPVSETILSPENLTVFFILLVLIPLILYRVSQHVPQNYIEHDFSMKKEKTETVENFNDKLDNSRIIAYSVALFILAYLVYNIILTASWNFMNLNFINMLFLSLGLLFHHSLKNYSESLEEAIKSVAGIILLFPFYAGIMGIMKYSGLAEYISNTISSFASQDSLPIFTFLSSAVLNLFVPSGGGQWAVQGGIIIDSVKNLGADLEQTIMAFSYGDELTNMLQPFWALPLLGITKLKAKEILPFTIIVMLISIPVFLFGIYLFRF
jgi:short-chain fatty acids transporter